MAIEAMIDICSHIIAENKLGAPEDYADVFQIMGKAGVFSEELVETLIEMIKFRNLLVHVYWKIEDRKIYDFLQQNLGDFKIFEDHIKAYLKDLSN